LNFGGERCFSAVIGDLCQSYAQVLKWVRQKSLLLVQFLKLLAFFCVEIVRNLVFFEVLKMRTCAFDAKTGFMVVKSGVKKNKPNSKPIQTQFKPKQTQNKPNQTQFPRHFAYPF